jgi:2,3,4,5-tetrahydropyridine-2,6-dicarboxylate N-succinyltransferase
VGIILNTTTKFRLRKVTPKKDIRVVPHAVARHGAYISKNVILMPSYVNIGAYVDEGTMVDTVLWAAAPISARTYI